MDKPLVIDYYTDMLCIWAWIAQRRIEELQEQWSDKVVLRHHYLNLFGDTETRIGQQWADRGGYEGFARHVQEAADPYDDAPVTDDLWLRVRPQTSANAHLVLKSVALMAGEKASEQFALQLRKAFFVHGVDIGQLHILFERVHEQGFDLDMLKQTLESGAAMAALMADYKAATELNIKGSPTWIMNHGRQTLYGNVGYRVLHANIEEILKNPLHEASWC